MSAEEERQAMLEKIRADMAQTRARLRDMKERKQSISLQAPPVLTPTGIAPPATSTPAPVTTPTAQKTETARSALSEATSAIEKLKAERAKKQLDTANTPANVVIVKKTEGSSLVGKKVDIGNHFLLVLEKLQKNQQINQKNSKKIHLIYMLIKRRSQNPCFTNHSW